MITHLIPFSDVPPPRRGCFLTVVIPARDEASRIGRTLEALAAQRNADGSPLAANGFDVLVYANNCSDETADVVRAVARRHPDCAIHVAEESLPPNVAHIGTARRAVMNAARARFASAGIPEAILASTDADTVPSPVWIAWTMREMAHAEAVMGRILVDADEWRILPAPIRQMLTDENAYHFAVAQLATQLDPKPHDPWPRHWQRSGPSFAVRLTAYDRSGGVPPLRALEDIALYDALVRTGARIRHSLRVRVTTSARLQARAPGGFGARIKAWCAQADVYKPFLVEDPEITVARLLGHRVGLPGEHPACIAATDATAVLREFIARGVREARATRNNVASIAG